MIFTNSDGWILKPKILIHLVAPFPRTPIISTDVGIASYILESKAIFDMKTYSSSRPSNKIAFQNVQKYTLPSWFENYKSLFKSMLWKLVLEQR